MSWVQRANIKGTKGDGYTNARISGDNLLIDEITRSASGTVTTTRTVGNVRGPQGVQGLPGTNAVPSDTAVAGYISTAGTSATLTALDSYMEPTMSREARAALADRIAAWISAEARNRRGDTHLQGTLRRMRIRKPSQSSIVLAELSAEDEEPQATATGLSLQFMAMYATVYPEKAQQVRPTVDRLVRTLEAMQSYDDRKPHYGGFVSAAGSQLYGALAAGQAVKGLVLAYERYGVGQWLEMAKLGGTFLRTLSNPNPVYQSLYGVDVITIPSTAHVMCDRISDQGKLDCTAYAWNLVGVHAMYELGRVTGDTSWVADAAPIRDFMAGLFLTHYDYYATRATAAGTAANLVDQTPTLQSTAPAGTNAYQRNGEATGKGTIESDSMEYALTALWHTGYNLSALKTAYERLAAMQMNLIPSTATTTFKSVYNSTNRFVSWPGYFRINDPEAGGASEAWGGYLDVQGAGELLAWKAAYYPTHYALTMPAIRAVVEPDRGALLKEDLTTQWTVEPFNVYAVQGTIPIAAAGLGLLETNPPYDLEVTA